MSRFDIYSTVGDHIGGTKFYEIVMVINADLKRGFLFQRNGKMELKHRLSAGAMRMMGTGDLSHLQRLFDKKIEDKGEYRLSQNFTVSKSQTLEDTLAAMERYNLGPYVVGPTIWQEVFGDVSASREEAVEEVQKVIPSYYGGW